MIFSTQRILIDAGNGIMLRNWEISDAPALTQIANNSNISDNLRDAFPHPYTLSDAHHFIEMSQDDADDKILLAVEYYGDLAGSIGAHQEEDVNRLSVEMGYFIAQKYWGKGIATLSVKALVNYIFSYTDIVRIFALPFEWNKASCKVLENAGFSLEAIMKKAVIKKGRIGDQCLYAITKK